MTLHETLTLSEKDKTFELNIKSNNIDFESELKDSTIVIGIDKFFEVIDSLSNRDEILSKILSAEKNNK